MGHPGPPTFISYGSSHKKLKVPPGPPGIAAEGAWIAESQYIRSVGAGEKPVDEIRIAARCAESNPRLAESALAHAQKNKAAGIDSEVFNIIAAEALHRDARYETALSYAVAANKELPVEARAMLNRIILESAYATFRYPMAKKVAEADARFQDLLPGINDEIDSYKQQTHKTALPNPAATAITFTDQIQNLVNTAPDQNNEAKVSGIAISHLKRDRTFPFSSPGGQYAVCRCGPGDANIDFSAAKNISVRRKIRNKYPGGRVGRRSAPLVPALLPQDLNPSPHPPPPARRRPGFLTIPACASG